MPRAAGSLWSSEIKPSIRSPFSILKEQADALTQQTNRVLVGELKEKNSDDKSLLTLNIIVPALEDYRSQILVATHDLHNIYPVVIDAEIFRSQSSRTLGMSTIPSEFLKSKKPDNRADSDTELIALLEKVLKSPQVISTAQSLIAKANEALENEENEAASDPSSEDLPK